MVSNSHIPLNIQTNAYTQILVQFLFSFAKGDFSATWNAVSLVQTTESFEVSSLCLPPDSIQWGFLQNPSANRQMVFGKKDVYIWSEDSGHV